MRLSQADSPILTRPAKDQVSLCFDFLISRLRGIAVPPAHCNCDNVHTVHSSQPMLVKQRKENETGGPCSCVAHVLVVTGQGAPKINIFWSVNSEMHIFSLSDISEML